MNDIFLTHVPKDINKWQIRFTRLAVWFLINILFTLEIEFSCLNWLINKMFVALTPPPIAACQVNVLNWRNFIYETRERSCRLHVIFCYFCDVLCFLVCINWAVWLGWNCLEINPGQHRSPNQRSTQVTQIRQAT